MEDNGEETMSKFRGGGAVSMLGGLKFRHIRECSKMPPDRNYDPPNDPPRQKFPLLLRKSLCKTFTWIKQNFWPAAHYYGHKKVQSYHKSAPQAKKLRF